MNRFSSSGAMNDDSWLSICSSQVLSTKPNRNARPYVRRLVFWTSTFRRRPPIVTFTVASMRRKCQVRGWLGPLVQSRKLRKQKQITCYNSFSSSKLYTGAVQVDHHEAVRFEVFVVLLFFFTARVGGQLKRKCDEALTWSS